MSESERKPLPPYLPYKTFVNFIEHLRTVGVPSHIDQSVMDSMSGSMQSWLKSALRSLQLVDADDVPTPQLHRLVDAEGNDRKAILKELFKVAYPFLDGKVDLKITTPQKLRAAIQALGAQGETIEKIVTFLVAMAKDAEITLSPLLQKRASPARRAKPKTQRKPADEESDEGKSPRRNTENCGDPVTAMKSISLVKSGGTITLSGNINVFGLTNEERQLLFELIDTMRRFEDSQGGEGS